MGQMTEKHFAGLLLDLFFGINQEDTDYRDI